MLDWFDSERNEVLVFGLDFEFKVRGFIVGELETDCMAMVVHYLREILLGKNAIGRDELNNNRLMTACHGTIVCCIGS